MMIRSLILSTLLLGLSAAGPVSAATTATLNHSPGIAQQNEGADTYAFTIGSVRVTALSDGSVPQNLHKILHGITNKEIDERLAQAYLTNPVEVSINAFLLELGNKLVLVDTGVGQLFGSKLGGQLIESLQAAGVKPEQITDVLLTHVHSDHMGGLTRDGQRVFPNATVHVGKPDVDFFLDPQHAEQTDYDQHYFDQAETILEPYVKAGKIDTFDKTTEVLPGLTASLHPGHTPGSAFFTLESEGQTLTFTGDIVHVAAVQLPDPSVTIAYDVDQKKARKVRTAAFADFAKHRDLVAVPHMPFPGIGRIRKVGEGYEWVPINYGNREVTTTK
nr:ribonuclease Z [Virgibacillus halodenitrificans]